MLVEWLCERLELVPTRHIVAIGSTNSEGKLLGVAGYDNFTGSCCEMHMAGVPGWLTKKFLAYAFYYPFVELKCKTVIGKVAASNTRTLKIDKQMGWRELCIIPDAYPDGDMHVLIMRRKECKWLEVYSGQEEQSTAAA